MKEMFLLNPKRRRRGRRSSATRRRRNRPSPSRWRRNPVAVSGKRRKRRGGGRRRSRGLFGLGGGGSGSLGIKSLMNKDLLWTAGGVVAGAMATGFVWKRFGPYQTDTNGNYVKDSTGNLTLKPAGAFKLPMSDSSYGPTIYRILIPLGLGILAQKIRPLAPLAKGAVIGGLASGVSELVNKAVAATSGTGAYLNQRYVSPVGRMNGGSGARIGAVGGAMTPSRAFRTAAWRR